MKYLVGVAAGVWLSVAITGLAAAGSGEAPKREAAERQRSKVTRGEEPVLPPGSGRVMLPEQQRLLETRLEDSSWRPFQGFGVHSLWEGGPRGWLDLSLGLSLGGRDGIRNLALNGGLELTPWLRTHVTAVARPHQTRLSSERILQEAYLEAFRGWRMGGGRFATSLKLGTTQNLTFPYPDALSLFDLGTMSDGRDRRDLRGYKHMVGVADYSHGSGLGLHAAAAKRFIHTQGALYDDWSGDTRAHMIDYYLRYRGGFRGLTLEGRVGALNPGSRLGPEEMPHRPRPGHALYIGKEWQQASAGFLLEKVGETPLRYGVRLNMPIGAVSEVLGNFLGRYHRRERTMTAQLPLGSLILGQRLEPPADGELVGTVRATQVYRTGSFLGTDEYPLNYEYVVDREGETEGPGLTRVRVPGPRYLWEGGTLGGRGLDGTQLYNNFREDVTYNLYRVARTGTARLTVRVLDAASPERALPAARVVRLDAPEGSRLVSGSGGRFSLEEKVPLAKPRSIKLMASASGYLDEIVTGTLRGGQEEAVEIRLKAALGRLTVEVLDAESGAPVREVEIHVAAGTAKPKVLLTDEKGAVQAPSLAPGRYRVSTYAPRYYDQKAEIAIPAAGAERIALRLKPRPGSIAGRLLNADGKPVVGAAITVTDTAGHGLGVLTTLTDGTFGMTGLKPGRYTVEAKTTGGASNQATAEVKAGEIETVEITLK